MMGLDYKHELIRTGHEIITMYDSRRDRSIFKLQTNSRINVPIYIHTHKHTKRHRGEREDQEIRASN